MLGRQRAALQVPEGFALLRTAAFERSVDVEQAKLQSSHLLDLVLVGSGHIEETVPLLPRSLVVIEFHSETAKC
ncbi:hypothetical protein OESDEN_15754 [Oesophagostomum dentatum]|uniref:Uncharacterized protein n=1 Tax=Oesophagostomum dentatum TaxID=61180 RepID=A0A0B1SMT7_OESDE|nr:hypothetical protein OESDEN_15754 [Oesophagostomum dentatum]